MVIAGWYGMDEETTNKLGNCVYGLNEALWRQTSINVIILTDATEAAAAAAVALMYSWRGCSTIVRSAVVWCRWMVVD